MKWKGRRQSTNGIDLRGAIRIQIYFDNDYDIRGLMLWMMNDYEELAKVFNSRDTTLIVIETDGSYYRDNSIIKAHVLIILAHSNEQDVTNQQVNTLRRFIKALLENKRIPMVDKENSNLALYELFNAMTYNAAG